MSAPRPNYGACQKQRFSAGLKKLLKKHAVGETLAVLDSKLGNIVKEKMGIDCVYR